jgi:hypothetical protein
MPTITTDMRETLDWMTARRIRFEPELPITATNLQDAIEQAITVPQTITATPVSASPYAPTNSDSYLAVDTTAGPITINLQAAAARIGLPLVIKDVNGHAAANNITLVPSGAETIDGLAPYLMDSNFSAINLYPKAAGGYSVAP